MVLECSLKSIQDIVVQNICVKLCSNWSVNEGGRVLTKFFSSSKNSTVTLTLALEYSNLSKILSYLTFM